MNNLTPNPQSLPPEVNDWPVTVDSIAFGSTLESSLLENDVFVDEDCSLIGPALAHSPVKTTPRPDIVAKYIDQVTGLINWQGVAQESQDLYFF